MEGDFNECDVEQIELDTIARRRPAAGVKEKLDDLEEVDDVSE